MITIEFIPCENHATSKYHIFLETEIPQMKKVQKLCIQKLLIFVIYTQLKGMQQQNNKKQQ